MNVYTIEEIIKIVATRCQILRLKCIKSFAGWASLQCSPRSPNWILRGLLLRGGEGTRGEGRGGEKRKGGIVEGRGQGRPPKPKLGPQNYFPGTGAGLW